MPGAARHFVVEMDRVQVRRGLCIPLEVQSADLTQFEHRFAVSRHRFL